MCIVKSGLVRHSQSHRLDPSLRSLPLNLGRPTPNVTWTLNDSELKLDQMTTSTCPSSPSSPMMSISMSVTPPSLVVSRLRSSCIPRWHLESVNIVSDHPQPSSGASLGPSWAASRVTTTSPFPPSPQSTSMCWVSTNFVLQMKCYHLQSRSH